MKYVVLWFFNVRMNFTPSNVPPSRHYKPIKCICAKTSQHNLRGEAKKCGIVSFIPLSHYAQEGQESYEQAQSSTVLHEQKLELVN